MKYLNYDIVFEEVPNEVTLAINITNCQHRCEDCHSPELREDIGEELTNEVIDKLIEENYGITCICFMGEGKNVDELKELVTYIREKYLDKYKLAVYSGRKAVDDWYFETFWVDFSKDHDQILVTYFDYIKVGPYKPEFGPLNKETTNQRMYVHNPFLNTSAVINDKVYKCVMDITNSFWR